MKTVLQSSILLLNSAIHQSFQLLHELHVAHKQTVVFAMRHHQTHHVFHVPGLLPGGALPIPNHVVLQPFAVCFTLRFCPTSLANSLNRRKPSILQPEELLIPSLLLVYRARNLLCRMLVPSSPSSPPSTTSPSVPSALSIDCLPSCLLLFFANRVHLST